MVYKKCPVICSVLFILLAFFHVPVNAACPITEAPNALQPSETTGDDRPLFKWTAVSCAQSYTLYVIRVSDEAIVLRKTGLTGTTFQPSNPLPLAVPLRWKIKGESSYGPGPYSPSVYFTVASDFPCPPTEAPVTGGPQGTVDESTLTFSWQSVPRAQSYTLYVMRVSDEAILLRATDLTDLSYTPVAQLPPNTPLRWKVKAESWCGPGPYSSNVYFTVVSDSDDPCPPTQAPITGGPQGTINDLTPTFSWQPVPGAQSYTLYVIRVDDEAILLRATGITGSSSTPNIPLPRDVPLRWKVKSESLCGPGPYSPSVYFDIEGPSKWPDISSQ